MRRKSLAWHIYLIFLAIVFTALLSTAFITAESMRSSHIASLKKDLRIRGRLLSDRVTPLMAAGDFKSLARLVSETGRSIQTRITCILPDGTVVADSVENVSRMPNLADRKEVKAAIGGEIGFSARHGNALGKNLFYVAVALPSEDNKADISGVIRLAVPAADLERKIDGLFSIFLICFAVTAFLSWLIVHFIVGRITAPLKAMTEGARSFARGDFSRKMPLTGAVETAALAEAMNNMTFFFDDWLQTIRNQRNELEAVFASMVEGVIAVDRNQTTIRLNEAAAAMLSVDRENSHGRPVLEIIRNIELQKFIARTFNSAAIREGELTLYAPAGNDRHLQLHGARLQDHSGKSIGILVVMNDITNLRRLETIRRDFVANVSHELRTPLTSIKAAAETIVENNMITTEEARPFLDIVVRQSDRLNDIINDLLLLSRVEQETENQQISFQALPLLSVINSALQVCQTRISPTEITFEIDCDPRMEALLNSTLLEQVFINLFDNAVKYSGRGAHVHVRAEEKGDLVIVKVGDSGRGISHEHLPRLFERFYRADKARSHKIGGTGLGLAIVKHIIIAHGGTVSVDSTPGEGTTFILTLRK